MADRHQQPQPAQQNHQHRSQTTRSSHGSFLSKLQAHVPNSTQLIGLLTLLVSGGILLLLTGITITATVLGLIFFTPILIVSSPVWVPLVTVLFLTAAGFVSMCGFGAAVVGGLSWMYRYFKGMHPPGSDRVDYARSRIYDTASHVKDYAKDYGGYLHSKVKDAAPGA
ncbi:oleosin G-like [Argentina anserina]|uniref:oleosin G-like n=1 Tax=Argentina anserina TaxID=57926 RepID=UPI0021767548|nr:oleosin G-like [Potentilla anserina]